MEDTPCFLRRFRRHQRSTAHHKMSVATGVAPANDSGTSRNRLKLNGALTVTITAVKDGSNRSGGMETSCIVDNSLQSHPTTSEASDSATVPDSEPSLLSAPESPATKAGNDETHTKSAEEPKPKSKWTLAWRWCKRASTPYSSQPHNTTKTTNQRPHHLPKRYPAMPPTPADHVPHQIPAHIAAKLMHIDPNSEHIKTERERRTPDYQSSKRLARTEWENTRRECRLRRIDMEYWEGTRDRGSAGFLAVDVTGRLKATRLKHPGLGEYRESPFVKPTTCKGR